MLHKVTFVNFITWGHELLRPLTPYNCACFYTLGLQLNRVGSPFHYFSGDRHWLHTKTVGSCKFNYHTITTTMAPESAYHNDDSCHVYIMSLLLVLNKEIYFLSNTIAFLSLVLENSISIIANLGFLGF